MGIREAIEDGKDGWPLIKESWPIYVTREYSDFKMEYSVPGWVVLTILILAWINAIGWGIYGVVELVEKVI